MTTKSIRVPVPEPRLRAHGDVHEVIDFDRYLPTLLSKLVGKLRRSANAFFGERYGLTLLEWRILSFIAARGPSSAYAIWSEGELDKAAVSRALRELEARGLVAITRVAGSARQKTAVSLTGPGRVLHDETFAEVVARHGRLVAGFTAEELDRLLEQLRVLELRIPEMSRSERLAAPAGRRASPNRAGSKARL